jgi:hypothetical protein
VLAVVNHISVGTYAGLNTRFNSDELRRLCWLWEWDCKTLPAAPQPKPVSVEADEDENPFLSTPKSSRQKVVVDQDENPFLDTPKASRRLPQDNKSSSAASPKKASSALSPKKAPAGDVNSPLSTPKASQRTDKKVHPVTSSPAKKSSDEAENPFVEPSSSSRDWVRGGMGFVVSAATHYAKGSSKRVLAYGIGVEVEMDIDKGMSGGMAAVARWTSANDTRKQQLRKKLERWLEVCGLLNFIDAYF